MTRVREMLKPKLYLGLAGVLVAIAGVAIYAVGATTVQEIQGTSTEPRADVVTIDTVKLFEDLERPAVIFLHDLHTKTLEKKNKDCKTCHLEVKEPSSLAERKALSPKFKRLKDTNKQQVVDNYHTECITCHKEIADTGEKAGPIELCGKCHPGQTKVLSSRQPMQMDRSLHFRHIEATKDKVKNEDKCDRCHHEYDEINKKLYYAKEKEGSCGYCHKGETEKNRMSIRLASHLACVDCHRRELTKDPTLAQQKKIGPVQCAGCHDIKNQEKIEKIKDVPRIKRKQPDVVLLQADKKALAEEKKNELVLMDPVPFDHKAHEENNATCRVCHHESLDSCSKKCHTLDGLKDGDFIKLAQAMHQSKSDKSCLGCHDKRQQEKECVGCHASIEKSPMPKTPLCTTCHMKSMEDEKAIDGVKPEVIAEKLLKARTFMKDTYKAEDIPEEVVIKGLVDEYEAVKFPHRKIVQTLVKNTKDSKLANYFHREKGTMCQGCHHDSPAAKKPPRCSSCHGKPFDENNLFRPGLKGAYHQQCLGCHKEMNMEKPKPTDCKEACHKEKKK
jgi:hypothetical protein